MSELPALEERRVLWQTAWGVVAVIAAGLGGLIWQQASMLQSRIPVWPAYVFGVVALIGLYFVFTPVMHVWPFRRRKPRTEGPMPVQPPTIPGGLVAGVASFGDNATNTGNTTIFQGAPASPRQRTDDARDWQDVPELQAACAELGREILAYHDVRHKDSPWLVPFWFGLPQDADAAERHRASNEHSAKALAYDRETLSGYYMQFLGRALALFDEIDHRGWFDDPHRAKIDIEHPTNETGIRRNGGLFAKFGATKR